MSEQNRIKQLEIAIQDVIAHLESDDSFSRNWVVQHLYRVLHQSWLRQEVQMEPEPVAREVTAHDVRHQLLEARKSPHGKPRRKK
jgi:hypothetical protein